MSRRGGFTVVELLVVIAIIAVVAGLLLPAIQFARESSRRTACANNLRQFGAAFQQHHTLHEYYPSSGWGTYWLGDADAKPGMQQPGGWMYQILPYIEREGLYNMPTDGQGNAITAGQRQLAGAASSELVPLFYCPTRRQPNLYPLVFAPKPGGGLQAHNANDAPFVGRSDYVANGGDNRAIVWGVGPLPAAGNLMPNPKVKIGFPDPLPAPGGLSPAFYEMTKWDGTNPPYDPRANGICFQASQLSSTSLRDGASSTYLVGEKYLNMLAYENGTDPGDDQSLFSGDALDQLAWSDQAPMRDQRGITDPFRWGSAHDGVFQVVTCDGATHAVSYDIDAEVHRRLGNRADGLPVDQGQF